MGSPINCIQILILTRYYLSEIQTLQWSYVQGNRLRLPDSKTGAKSVYLGPAALEVLGKIERLDDNPFVVTGKLTGWTRNGLVPVT